MIGEVGDTCTIMSHECVKVSCFFICREWKDILLGSAWKVFPCEGKQCVCMSPESIVTALSLIGHNDVFKVDHLHQAFEDASK